MGVIGTLFSISFKFTLITSLILFTILLLPDNFFGDVKFQPGKAPQLTTLKVPSNVKIYEPTLDQIQVVELDQEVVGPESISLHNNFIYTGVVNGQILKINEKTKKVSVLTTLVDEEAKNCENLKSSNEACGRGLDLQVVDLGKISSTLYAVDTYHGFIEYDLIKNTKMTYDLRDKIPGYGNNEKIFNSIRQDPKNSHIVYISLSSTKNDFDKAGYTFLEREDSGILISFNKLTEKVTVIGKGFVFSNGLEIVEETLLLNDLLNQRILKYNLDEIHQFLDSDGKGDLPNYSLFKEVPGLPDNLTKDKTRLFVALFYYIPENDVFFNQISSNVHLRKLLFRLLYLAGEVLSFVGKKYRCDSAENFKKNIEKGEITMWLPYKSGVAILDQKTGDYIGLVQLPIQFVTHAVYNSQTNSLYLGSISDTQIRKLSLDFLTKLE